MRSLLLLLLLLLLVGTGCSVTSSIVIPPCADRLEVGGEHARQGRRLVFDHAFDPPFSKTEVTLKHGEDVEVVEIWNNQPDGGRLLVGAIMGIFGTMLWASALYEVGAHGAEFSDEGPFYSAILGSGSLVTGALLSLTGWHPRTPTDINEFCHEPAPSTAH